MNAHQLKTMTWWMVGPTPKLSIAARHEKINLPTAHLSSVTIITIK